MSFHWNAFNAEPIVGEWVTGISWGEHEDGERYFSEWAGTYVGYELIDDSGYNHIRFHRLRNGHVNGEFQELLGFDTHRCQMPELHFGA